MRVSPLLVAVTFVPVVAVAQRSPTTESFATIDLITTSVDPAHARASGFGSRGWGGMMGAGRGFLRVAVIGIDGAWIRHGDTESFRQSTTAGNLRSYVDAWSGSLWGGLRTPPMSKLVIGANSGFQGFTASRSIPDCVDCRIDDLSLNGGMFIEPAAYFRGNRAGAHVAYRHFLGDGHVKSTVLIGARIAGGL
jgi:hypothetical protein